MRDWIDFADVMAKLLVAIGGLVLLLQNRKQTKLIKENTALTKQIPEQTAKEIKNGHATD